MEVIDAAQVAGADASSIGRVILVTQYYPPEPVPNPEWLVRGLRSAGWCPSVLTGIPNYPSGKIYRGYKPWLAQEQINGVHITRIPLYPDHGSSVLGRAINYLSWSGAASVLGMPAMRRAELSLVYSTPATAALPAMLARAVLGRPYVLIVQDIWPDSIFASGFLTGGRARRVAESVLRRFAALAYSGAAQIVVTSSGMSELLTTRGVPDDKVTLIYNWVDEEVYKPGQADPRFRDGLGLAKEDFLVMYAGNHGAAQGLEQFIEAIASVPHDRRCHAVLIGEGVRKRALQEQAASVAPGRVHFLPSLESQAMTNVLPAADLHLISLRDEPLFYLTMPSKTQSLMAAGQPLLVCSPGDSARLASDCEIGLTARPGDSADLASTIVRAVDLGRDALREFGRRGRETYLREMSADVGSRRLSHVLRVALTGSERSGEPNSSRSAAL